MISITRFFTAAAVATAVTLTTGAAWAGSTLDRTEAVTRAIESGELDASVVEVAYDRITGVLRKAVATLQTVTSDDFDVDGHHALAREAASEAVVLLSNPSTGSGFDMKQASGTSA